MKLVLLLLVSAMVNFTAATEDSNNTESSYGSAIGSASGMSEQSISIITVSVRSSGIQTQTSSTLVMPTLSPTPGVDEEDLPLYAIIGGAAGGGLIMIIIVLLLILCYMCYLFRRLMKAERKERPIVSGEPAHNDPSSEDHTDRSRAPEQREEVYYSYPEDPPVHEEIQELQVLEEGYQSLSLAGMDYIHMYSHTTPLTGSETATTDFRAPGKECTSVKNDGQVFGVPGQTDTLTDEAILPTTETYEVIPLVL